MSANWPSSFDPSVGQGPVGAYNTTKTNAPAGADHGIAHTEISTVIVALEHAVGLPPSDSTKYLNGTGNWTAPPVNTGPPGPTGSPAWTLNASSFTVPVVGQTVVVTVSDTSWAVVGEYVWVATAGGDPNTPMALQVTAKTSTTLTLLNSPGGAVGTPPSPHAVSHITGGSDIIPLASGTSVGLLRAPSGNTTDFLDGTHAWRDSHSLIPAGVIWDYAGGSAPVGWLLCDGSAVSRTTYAGLYTALGGASSPWGQGDGSTTFNVPDLRGRTCIGAGQGTGLTNRALAATGGEELHALSLGELAVHNHTASQSTHTHSDSGHYHYCGGVDHLHYCGGVDHLHGLGGHTHSYNIISTPGGVASGGSPYGNVGTSTGGPTTGSNAADRSLAFWSNASDRSLAFNSNNASAALSTDSAGAITVGNNGSGTGHNTMQPFAVVQKIIKT